VQKANLLKGMQAAAVREGICGMVTVHEAASVGREAQASLGVTNISSTTSSAAGSK
jgi:hypothetical protein